MKYTILGVVFVIVAYSSLIDIPTSNKLLVCAGITQSYYDRLFGKSFADYKGVGIYFKAAVQLLPETEPLNRLYFSEGMYQAAVLNTDQLVTEMLKCKKLL